MLNSTYEAPAVTDLGKAEDVILGGGNCCADHDTLQGKKGTDVDLDLGWEE